MVRIYTDGSCKDGVGSWSNVILKPTKIEVKSGICKDVTCNNSMELYAVIEALRYVLANQLYNSRIVTDSAYVLTGMQKVNDWKCNHWQNARGKRIKNQELWKDMEGILSQINESNCYNVVMAKTLAHSGDSFNEKADRVVRRELKKYFEGSTKKCKDIHNL